MPRNNAKKHSPANSTKATSDASNAGATISHFTQSDDEGNVIIELDIRPHNEECSNHDISDIPEVEPESASSASATVVVDVPTAATTVVDVPALHIDFESSQSVFASMSSPELLPSSDAHNNAVAVVSVAIVHDSSDSVHNKDAEKNASVASSAAHNNPEQNSDLKDINIAPSATSTKSGFFSSLCRCFKGMCNLMCFSCCCCRRRRWGSTATHS